MLVAIQSESPKYNYQFEVADTGLIGVYGISGCGKSSLLNALAGYNDKNVGTIVFNNKTLQGIVKCSYMNQHPILFPHWTVLENLNFAIGYSKSSIKKLDDLLDKLNCNHLLNKLPKQLSGGEKQRIAFIRALLMIENNSLVLLDEPFSALHPELRKVALDLLNDYKNHCLIFMVTHDISEIYQYADELLLIEEGSISHQSSIEQAMSSMHSGLPLASKIKLADKIYIVYADDVSIALEKNTNSSIVHQLDGTIQYIETNKHISTLKLVLENSQQILYSTITEHSLKQLNLKLNQSVVAYFKATASNQYGHHE